MSRAARRVLTVLCRGTALAGEQRPSNLPSLPPSATGKEDVVGSKSGSIATDELSSLFNHYGIVDFQRNPVDATKLDKTTLQISSPREYSGIRALSRSTIGLPNLQSLQAYIHTSHAKSFYTLAAFVEKLASVSCIGLYICFIGSSEPVFSRGMNLAFSRLLSVVSSRGCSSLSICEQIYCLLCSQQAAPSKKHFLSPTSLSFKPKHSLRSTDTPTLSDLLFLHISLPLMLTAPWIEWTIRTINSSALYSLFLTPTTLPSPDWSSILPLIFSPQIMTLLTQGVDMADLIPFLSRHKELRYISPFPELPLKPCRFPVGFTLPQLTTVTGTPEIIFHLLSKTQQSARPHLSSFTISNTGYLHDHHLDKMLPFLQTIQAIQGIHLPNVQFTCTVPCLECLTWLISQPMAKLPTSKVDEGVYRVRLAYNRHPQDPPFPFDDMHRLLPCWLSSFPYLKEFTFQFGAQSSRWADDERELIQSILKYCPGISTIAFA